MSSAGIRHEDDPDAAHLPQMDEIGSTPGRPGAATDRPVDEAASSIPSMARRKPDATLDA
jgi:hypothetical protein